MGYFDGCAFEDFRESFDSADPEASLNALFGFISRHRGPILAALRAAQDDMAEYEARARFLARKAGLPFSELVTAGQS